ncbi:MAG TPA: hypothetical protein VFJ82_19160 [Longimicrobium sp.]|nr:hypothetical protein [Longimicrobium sp.]
MRIVLLLVTLFVSAAPLAAQPAADAPVPQHVAYLLDAARDGFSAVRGQVTYGPGMTYSTAELASRHAIRFQGVDARSELRVNLNWNVLHQTLLPVAGGRAATDSAWARLSAQIAAVIPRGWIASRNAETRHAIWQECEQGRGREVALSTSLPFEQPYLTLIVYRYDQPCPAPAGGGGAGG